MQFSHASGEAMSQKLVERADALRAKAKLVESVRGSGYHDDDRNVARPDLPACPQKTPDPARPGHLLPRLSDHVVFFTDYPGEEVTFAGADAERVLAALKSWEQKAARLDPLNLTGTERKLVTRILPRTALTTDAASGAAVLRVRLDQWNDVLHALYSEGLGVSGLPLEE